MLDKTVSGIGHFICAALLTPHVYEVIKRISIYYLLHVTKSNTLYRERRFCFWAINNVLCSTDSSDQENWLRNGVNILSFHRQMSPSAGKIKYKTKNFDFQPVKVKNQCYLPRFISVYQLKAIEYSPSSFTSIQIARSDSRQMTNSLIPSQIVARCSR